MQTDRHPIMLAGLLVITLVMPARGLAFTNTLVNDPTTDLTARDTQSGTTTIVFGSTVLTAFNDSGSSAGGAERYTGWSRSTDGGVTFTDLGALTSSPIDFGFPFLARSALTGTVFLANLAGNGGVQVFRSTNGGLTFPSPVSATPGIAPSAHFDRLVLAVDNFAGGGNVYMLSTDLGGSSPGVRFFRSVNDGITWGPSGGVAIVSALFNNGAFLAVAPNHDVYAFWYQFGLLSVRRSTDLGVSFGAADTVTTTSPSGSPGGDLGLGGFRSNRFPQAAVNPVNGNVYVIYADNPAGTDRADIFFRQLTDNGATWGAAVRVNDDATTRDQWQPSLAVTPDGTRVFVGWYDRRLDAANNMIDNYSRIGTVSGATVTFGPDFRITDQSYPPVFGVDPALLSTYMGDWDEAAADNNFFYYSWGDNRDPSTGHAGNQANVRLAKIPVAGTTSVEPAAVATAQPALTRRANPFSGGLELALDLETASSNVELEIYDVGGRRIAETDFGALGVGTHPLLWDGRGASGRDAGPGIFLAVVRIDGRALTQKVVRLK